MAKTVDYETLALKLGVLFKPSAPIDKEDLFCGRSAQVRLVVDAINQIGQHAVIFGERGVGKTSLSQILQVKLKATNEVPVIAPRVTCDSLDNFTTIWRKVFAEASGQEGPHYNPLSDADDEDADDEMELTPNEVRKFLEAKSRDGLIYVILDEFDKMPENGDVRQLTADTIKLLSDRAVHATLIVVGVSDSVTGLIHDHRSIERCLTQVPMPRMMPAELEEIVNKGLAKVGMSIEDSALAEITGLSKGLPHYTHLLALHAGRAALDQRMMKVSEAHVKKAVGTAVGQSVESIRREYDKATYTTKKQALYTQVLLACAMAECDEFGRFQPADLRGPLLTIMKEEFSIDRFLKHLHAFCNLARGPVLEKLGSEYRWKFRFTNPLMQPYVLMKALHSGTITEKDCRLDERPKDHLFRV
jgi:Cdc6-like AAA superfamily ATPase